MDTGYIWGDLLVNGNVNSDANIEIYENIFCLTFTWAIIFFMQI